MKNNKFSKEQLSEEKMENVAGGGRGRGKVALKKDKKKKNKNPIENPVVANIPQVPLLEAPEEQELLSPPNENGNH